METISFAINKKSIVCPEGMSVFDVARNNAIQIPSLCNHHSLKPHGACRICLVEDEKTGRLLASCVTPAVQDMSVMTDSPAVIRHRRNIIRLMIAEHPESCIVCNKGNRCKLRQIAAQHGIGENELYPMPNYKQLEQANPFIQRDLSKCILCGKCIRADHELVVTGAIDYNQRGFPARPATAHDLPLEHSNCTFCGTCISICPTGALSPKLLYVGSPEKESISICGFCGVGCSLKIGVVGKHVVDVNPAHIQKTVNDATLCVRGHFAHDYLNSSARLTHPLIRKNGRLEKVSWDEAMETVSSRLLKIKKDNGPQSIAFFGSSKCTNEENYLFQKMARTIIRTNNIDNGGHITGRLFLDMIESRTDKEDRFNFFAGPLSGLEKAEIIFVLGADPDNCVPVANYYLKRGAKKGIPLIVAGPRRTDLTDVSSLWLPLCAGDDTSQNTPKNTGNRFYLEIINGLSALLVEKESWDALFVERFTKSFDQYKEALSRMDMKRVCQVTNSDFDSLKAASELLSGKKIAFVIGHEILTDRYAYQTMDALLNLALMTGSIGYEGAGFYVLTPENNAVGAWDMGTVPDMLPGRMHLSESPALKIWEDKWETKLSRDQGLDIYSMIQSAEQEKLKALYIMGENPVRALPQKKRITNAFKKIDFIIVQDILLGETAEIADVVLPGAASPEKEGSFVNMEGRIQVFPRAVQPPGQARSDLEILGELCSTMGYPNYAGTSDEIRREIGKILPVYSSLNKSGQSVWIRETDKRIDKSVGKSAGKSAGNPSKDKAELIRFSEIYITEDEPFDEEYPFIAFLVPVRFHLGSGTRTSMSSSVTELNLLGEIEMASEDVQKLGLKDQGIVRIVSRHGSILRKFKISKNNGPGMLFIPMALNKNDSMNLIDLTGMPASISGERSNSRNSCRVKIERSSPD